MQMKRKGEQKLGAQLYYKKQSGCTTVSSSKNIAHQRLKSLRKLKRHGDSLVGVRDVGRHGFCKELVQPMWIYLTTSCFKAPIRLRPLKGLIEHTVDGRTGLLGQNS